MREKLHPYFHLGGFLGAVLGFIVAMVYQTWVITYMGKEGWSEYTPLFWKEIYDYPVWFTVGVVLIFYIISLVFVSKLLAFADKQEAQKAS